MNDHVIKFYDYYCDTFPKLKKRFVGLSNYHQIPVNIPRVDPQIAEEKKAIAERNMKEQQE